MAAERLPVGLRLYRRLTKAATPLAPLVLSHRLRKGKEDPDRMSERRGESVVARPLGPLVWAHGASIGEMLAILPLVERIHAQGFAVLVTSGTLTSARLMERRLPPGVIHQFIPLDAPVFITRFFDHWRPNLALIAESELWPNLIVSASERRIPMILVNGRLSTRSFTRWRYARESISALLSRFDLCLAQSAGDAERYAELGAPRVETTGNLKLDVEAPPADAQKLASLRAATGNRPLFAAASTHPGEETIVAEMHGRLKRMLPGLLTILVPRHPQRGAAIADIVKLAGLNPGLRSQGVMPNINTDIYIMDTIGELGIVYRLAPIVFLGGSLVPHGGQNPIEAAKLDCAILHGPNVWNFGEIYEALDQAGGAQLVADPKRLVACVGALLGDNAERSKTAASAQKTVDRLGGAMARTLSVLEPYLLQLRLETRQ